MFLKFLDILSNILWPFFRKAASPKPRGRNSLELSCETRHKGEISGEDAKPEDSEGISERKPFGSQVPQVPAASPFQKPMAQEALDLKKAQVEVS